MRYAHGIVSEYLADDLSKKLAQYLNLPDETDSKKRKLTSPKESAVDEKRQKKESLEGETLARNRALDLTKPEKVALDVFNSHVQKPKIRVQGNFKTFFSGISASKATAVRNKERNSETKSGSWIEEHNEFLQEEMSNERQRMKRRTPEYWRSYGCFKFSTLNG